MRSQRFLTMLVSLALLGLPALVLGAAPAQAATVTRVLIDLQPPKQLFRSPVQVAAILQSQEGDLWVNRPGLTVTLERKLVGGSWSAIASTVTQTDDVGTPDDETGLAVFSSKAKSNASYRVRFAGDVTYDPGVSAEEKVKVARDLGAKKKQIGKGKFRFYGKVKPDYGKKKLVLQKRQGGKWRSIGSQKTSRKGNWSFVVFAKRTPGEVEYRTVAAKDKKFIKSYSATFKITTIPA